MTLLLQQVINGIALGSVYALFALGFSLVFGTLEILNLAHAAVFMWGAFIAVFLVTVVELPLPIAFVLTMILGGFVGIILDRLAFRPLRKRGSSEFAALISSLAMLLIMNSIAQIASGTRVLRFPPGTIPISLLRLGPLRISTMQLAMLLVSMGLMVGLYLWLHRTRAGQAIRAVTYDHSVARLLGINADRVITQAFFVSSALAAGAGVLVGLAFNYIFFRMGNPYLLRGFTVVILGGMGSIEGAMVGGLFLGLAEVFSAGFISSQYRDAISFTILVLVLFVRPTGLFGSRETHRP